MSVSSNCLCHMTLSPTTYLLKVIVLINNFLFKLCVVLTLLVSSGSVETNPGPFIDTHNTLSFATWNLDSLPVREVSRISVVESLQAVHNFDIFAVCESSLHEHMPNENISSHGFSPDRYRADKSPNAHNGGVCLYFKESLPIKRRPDLELLGETIVAEITQRNNKRMFFVVSYRHPNQPSDAFEAYFSSLDNIIEKIANEKPWAIVLTGDFNARSINFRENDTGTREGHLLSEIVIDNSLGQLIDEPTHIRDDGTQTCIELIFTNQSYAFANVEILSHPEPQSKHLIIHGKIKFSVPCPPPYKRKVWEYNKANLAQINYELANIFNYYFSHQCSLNDTPSTLPSLYLRTESKFFYGE